MGLGKTIITLSVIADLKAESKLIDAPVLLVGTIRIIYSVWRQEAQAWEHTKGLRFSIVHGSRAERMTALRRPADIYLINYENLRWLQELTAIDKPKFGVFVSDESTRLKAHKTKRFRSLRIMLDDTIKRRWELTGTPAPNSMMDLWSQIFILDDGATLGRQFDIFKQRYFETDPEDFSDYPRYVPRLGAVERIQRLVAPMVMRLDARDYITMPKIEHNVIYLTMPPEIRAQYDEMERRMFLRMDDIDVEVFNAATLTTKCWQFANGAIYGTERENNTRDWATVHDAKLEALEEVLEEMSGKPLLIGYWFKTDLARLLQRLKKFFGKEPPVVKGVGIDKLVKEWNNGEHKAMLAHPVTAAHGLNIQKGPGHTLFMFSQTWSLELYDQLIARLARQGQESEHVMVHHPIMRDTTDEAMRDALRIKAANQSGLLDALRRYRAAKELLS